MHGSAKKAEFIILLEEGKTNVIDLNNLNVVTTSRSPIDLIIDFLTKYTSSILIGVTMLIVVIFVINMILSRRET